MTGKSDFTKVASAVHCFSEGAQDIFDKLAKIKSPDPIIRGSLSHLAARQRWVDWCICIFQRNVFNVITKSIASGIRICNGRTSTALPLEFVTEATAMGSLTGDPQNSDPSSIPDAPNMAVPQFDEMARKGGFYRPRDLHPMSARILLLGSCNCLHFFLRQGHRAVSSMCLPLPNSGRYNPVMRYVVAHMYLSRIRPGLAG